MPGEGVGMLVTLYVGEAAPGASFGQGAQGHHWRG